MLDPCTRGAGDDGPTSCRRAPAAGPTPRPGVELAPGGGTASAPSRRSFLPDRPSGHGDRPPRPARARSAGVAPARRSSSPLRRGAAPLVPARTCVPARPAPSAEPLRQTSHAHAPWESIWPSSTPARCRPCRSRRWSVGWSPTSRAPHRPPTDSCSPPRRSAVVGSPTIWRAVRASAGRKPRAGPCRGRRRPPVRPSAGACAHTDRNDRPAEPVGTSREVEPCGTPEHMSSRERGRCAGWDACAAVSSPWPSRRRWPPPGHWPRPAAHRTTAAPSTEPPRRRSGQAGRRPRERGQAAIAHGAGCGVSRTLPLSRPGQLPPESLSPSMMTTS